MSETTIETEISDEQASNSNGLLSGWILIEEQKPEDHVRALTYPGWATSNGVYIDEWCEQYDCFLMSIEDGHRVTHWMPLPQIPTIESVLNKSLLPCKCGCKADMQREKNNYFWVYCHDCHETTNEFQTEIEALEDWNSKAR